MVMQSLYTSNKFIEVPIISDFPYIDMFYLSWTDGILGTVFLLFDWLTEGMLITW